VVIPRESTPAAMQQARKARSALPQRQPDSCSPSPKEKAPQLALRGLFKCLIAGLSRQT
jgi:hypothetical protein